jgi:hypothetical protein
MEWPFAVMPLSKRNPSLPKPYPRQTKCIQTRRSGSAWRLRLPSPMARCQHQDCGVKLRAGGS